MVKGRSLSLGAWLVGVVALVVAAGQLLGPAASGAMAPMSQTYSGVGGMSGQMLLSGQAYAKHKVGDLTYHGMVTNAQRQAAAELLAQQKLQALLNPLAPTRLAAPARGAGPLAVPDYFGGVANWANSPLAQFTAGGAWITGTGIRKFVDSLPGLNAPNDLGQELPIAVPDTTTYPGSDYYEISLRQYTEKMHSDLPATTLRGYVQTNNGTDPLTQQNTVAPAPIHYLGPIIIAQRNRPVRIKFTNELPTGAAGNLFLPVDTTVMGAGTGPNGGTENYTQNRAVLHLHGGATPWISDGTPNQWITPKGETTSYPKGVSVMNVPDMPNPGAGSQTYYYTNQQSARLMFYHDHAFGITRLNVYAGEAAGYVRPGCRPRRPRWPPAPCRPTRSRSSSRTRPSCPIRPRAASSRRKTPPGTWPATAARATSGSRTSTCPTRTRSSTPAPTPWAAGTTDPGSGHRSPPRRACSTARSPTRTTTRSTSRGSLR